MAQGLCHRKIGVVELDVFSYQADADGAGAGLDALHHLLPIPQVRLGHIDVQFPADDGGKACLFQIQGRFVQDGQGQVLDNAVGLHIAEIGDFPEDAFVGDGLVTAQDDDVRGNAHALQLLYRVLGGLGLVLAGGLEIGHQGHVDVQGVVRPHLVPHLADGLDKGLAFDVADGAADLRDDDVRPGLAAHAVDETLDLVGDVGDGLHRAAQILSPPLLGDDVGIDLSRGQVGELVQVLVDEPLIVAQVQVGLRAVLGDIDLAVLIGAHGAGVHVDIGVQLLGRHLQAPGLQQTPQGCCRDPFSQTGDHTAGHKNILCHDHPS